jgi:hypothetical protein
MECYVIETGNLISLSGAVNTTDNFCKNISIIWYGDQRSKILRDLAIHDKSTWSSIECISNKILYAPNLYSIEDLGHTQPRSINDQQELRASLEAIQRALNTEIFSSTMILTPDKMQQAIIRNPWEALMGVRPTVFFNAKIPYEGIMIQFEYSDTCYLGWHMRVALQRLFQCALHLPEFPDTPPTTVEDSRIAIPVPTLFNNKVEANITPQSTTERYKINADGTVIDTKTSLMWQRCCQGQRWTGSDCEGNPSTMTLDEAYAAKVQQAPWHALWNNQSQAWPSFAGYKDWRLPTIEELRSLVWCSNGTPQEEAWKYGCSGMGNRSGAYQKPTLNINVFPNTPPWQFWSSTPSAYSSASSRAWVVYFGGGCVNDFAGSYRYAVRLVRDL